MRPGTQNKADALLQKTERQEPKIDTIIRVTNSKQVQILSDMWGAWADG